MATKPQNARAGKRAEGEAAEAEGLRSENARLRALVAAYEEEITDLRARTSRLVAEAQERGYWLDVIGLSPERLRASRAARAAARLVERARRVRARLRDDPEPQD